MELFSGPQGDTRVFFRNLITSFGLSVVFDPQDRMFKAIDNDHAPCANRQQIDCNWRAPGPGMHCLSCSMTHRVPDLHVGDNLALWAEAEAAKRWVIAALMRWGYFLPHDQGLYPEFHFLSESTSIGPVDVVMGHEDGVITINIQEANPAIREHRKQQMEERYRTMTGHIRHELGHAFFMRLQTWTGFSNAFRALFGDERADYAEALQWYYNNGAPADYASRHLTHYASSHPHEDWAETFAHYLHLIDMLDSARATGLKDYWPDPYQESDAQAMLSAAADLGIALNHVNRALGMDDLYPFVFSPVTREKLSFVHHWMRTAAPGY